MVIESAKDFSETALFAKKATPDRLVHVTRAMGHLLRGRYIDPDFHVRHQNEHGGGETHTGWFAHELETKVDVYDSRAQRVVSSIQNSKLFISEDGGLRVCVTSPGALPEEQILDAHRLWIHDDRLGEDEGVLSVLQPVYGTRLAAAAVTLLAGRHGIIEPLKDFAKHDPPLPHEW